MGTQSLEMQLAGFGNVSKLGNIEVGLGNLSNLGTLKFGLGNAHVGLGNVGEMGMLVEGIVSFFFCYGGNSCGRG